MRSSCSTGCGREDMGSIVDIQFGRLGRLLEDRKIKLALDAKGRQWLADRGYDPRYGARPLKRVIQKWVQDPLAQQLLAGEIREGSTVKISAAQGRLTINGKPVGGGEDAERPAGEADDRALSEIVTASRPKAGASARQMNNRV